MFSALFCFFYCPFLPVARSSAKSFRFISSFLPRLQLLAFARRLPIACVSLSALAVGCPENGCLRRLLCILLKHRAPCRATTKGVKSRFCHPSHRSDPRQAGLRIRYVGAPRLQLSAGANRLSKAIPPPLPSKRDGSRDGSKGCAATFSNTRSPW